MFLLKSQLKAVYGRPHLTFCVLKGSIKSLSSNPQSHTEACHKPDDHENNLEILFNKFQNKLLFNSIIDTEFKKLGYKRYKAHLWKIERENNKIQESVSRIQPLPVSLKYILDDINPKQPVHTDKKVESCNNDEEKPIQFPYNTSDSYCLNEEQKEQKVCNEEEVNDQSFSIKSEIEKRNQLLASKESWMSGYDNFENDLEHEVITDYWKINYGTEDPKSKISNVPCGGCGAFLHCKDNAIPGYIPSEIFKNCGKKGAANLKSIVCQRCYFLKEYNLALQVRVSPDDYPKLLTTIQDKKALVVLMVDLLDFPCSIWPGIADILGPYKPVVIVGNKIDLLPTDGNNFLDHMKENLLEQLKLSGFATSNILHVSLISAKTGFGIEDLITSLQSLKHKGIGGDVYLIGCTNVGKSSLFNAFLQSDYCKIQVSDLIQRATISQWPGTTLNLLKFPITRLAGYRLHQRHQRLQAAGRITQLEKRLERDQRNKIRSRKYASLIGHIGQTFTMDKYNVEEGDDFSVRGKSNETGKLELGINENHPDLALSRWCFDTPGVIQPDQILNLLTVEELMATLPKEIIKPETFCVKPGTSVFIAGLARLDYIDGPNSIRLTVFRSGELPITICHLESAEYVYNECLGTEMFKVPLNVGDRLSKWPGLQPSKPFTVTGTGFKISCNDVVLSSAGWIAINATPNMEYKFQAWTPEKRGIYVRDCLLPKAVMSRGARVKFSVAYKT